jgi:predicted  nucleic acid-binding Zn-ribbon protein
MKESIELVQRSIIKCRNENKESNVNMLKTEKKEMEEEIKKHETEIKEIEKRITKIATRMSKEEIIANESIKRVTDETKRKMEQNEKDVLDSQRTISTLNIKFEQETKKNKKKKKIKEREQIESEISESDRERSKLEQTIMSIQSKNEKRIKERIDLTKETA